MSAPTPFEGHDAVQYSNRFSTEDLKAIEISENEQSQFKELVATSKNFSKTEKAVIEYKTVAEFDTFWQLTNSAKEEFDQSHERGCGLCMRRYQSSAVVAQSFMEDFSPIINIVKSFAAPYGGMAVGTISILFAVAANKNGMEERLESVISAIKDRLPGLKMYQHIYNDNHGLDKRLQARIVSAYQDFIEFCIAATKYYKRGGLGRWLRALGPRSSIFDKADKVQDVIAEIRLFCEELLDKNVHSIKQLALEQRGIMRDQEMTMTDQMVTIKKLEEQVKNQTVTIERLVKARENSSLNEIRRLLNLSGFSEAEQRKEQRRYHWTLESDKDLNAAYFQQMRGARYVSFKACKNYQSWIMSEQPCLLILSGENNMSINQLDQCWLSPVAMAMINDLSEDTSRPIHAYYIFPQPGELLYNALSVIFIQLLRQKSHVLTNGTQGDELRAELEKLQKCDNNPKETDNNKLSAFHRVALRVMSFFNESETVYIILDRADRCCNLKRRHDHRKPLLKELVKMVEAARCKLKVLVVINAHQWRVEARQDELGMKLKERVIIHTEVQGYRTDSVL